MRRLLLVLSAALAACSSLDKLDSMPEPLVDFQRMHPAAILDIRYATANNIAKKPLYPVAKCALRRSVAVRLDAAARELEARGLRVKLFDCYRPASVQRALWAVKPDDRFVANPIKGSRHNRGAAIDITLADASGRELEMPSAFDDFSEKAYRGQGSPQARANSLLLQKALEKHGFVGLSTEWWHYDAKGWEKHPVEEADLAAIP